MEEVGGQDWFFVVEWGITKKKGKEGEIVRRLRRLTQIGMGGDCGSMRKCAGFMKKRDSGSFVTFENMRKYNRLFVCYSDNKCVTEICGLLQT
jgi:hypothetical protein